MVLSDRATGTVHGVYGSATEEIRQQRQVRERLVKIWPESTPFFTMLQRAYKMSDGRANKFEWQGEGEYPRTVSVSTEVAASGTSITVADAAHVTESQILQDTVTGEQLLVLSKSGNVLTVATRGSQGGGAPAIIQAGRSLLLLGTSREEGADRLAATGIGTWQDYNYFQQFELVSGITDRAINLLYYGEDETTRKDREMLNEYKKRIERQFLFGYRKKLSPGDSGSVTHPRFHAGGLREYIETGGNVFDAGGAFTFQELDQYMQETTREGGSGMKVGFASQRILSIMSRWALANHQADASKAVAYGVKTVKLIGPTWELELIRNEQFEDDTEYSSWLMVVDPKYVEQHSMRGLGDQVNRGITGPKNDGSHTVNNQLTGTHTLAVLIPNSMAIIKNIRS